MCCVFCVHELRHRQGHKVTSHPPPPPLLLPPLLLLLLFLACMTRRRAQEALDQKLQRAMQEAHDVALRNDALMAENTNLRQEVARLRQENTDLLLFAKVQRHNS